MFTISYHLIDNGRARFLIKRRPDGYFQVFKEELRETDELYPYWAETYPPSGVFGSEEDCLNYVSLIINSDEGEK